MNVHSHFPAEMKCLHSFYFLPMYKVHYIWVCHQLSHRCLINITHINCANICCQSKEMMPVVVTDKTGQTISSFIWPSTETNRNRTKRPLSCEWGVLSSGVSFPFHYSCEGSVTARNMVQVKEVCQPRDSPTQISLQERTCCEEHSEPTAYSRHTFGTHCCTLHTPGPWCCQAAPRQWPGMLGVLELDSPCPAWDSPNGQSLVWGSSSAWLRYLRAEVQPEAFPAQFPFTPLSFDRGPCAHGLKISPACPFSLSPWSAIGKTPGNLLYVEFCLDVHFWEMSEGLELTEHTRIQGSFIQPIVGSRTGAPGQTVLQTTIEMVSQIPSGPWTCNGMALVQAKWL